MKLSARIEHIIGVVEDFVAFGSLMFDHPRLRLLLRIRLLGTLSGGVDWIDLVFIEHDFPDSDSLPVKAFLASREVYDVVNAATFARIAEIDKFQGTSFLSLTVFPPFGHSNGR